jgi:hypothetical protein
MKCGCKEKINLNTCLSENNKKSKFNKKQKEKNKIIG